MPGFPLSNSSTAFLLFFYSSFIGNWSRCWYVFQSGILIIDLLLCNASIISLSTSTTDGSYSQIHVKSTWTERYISWRNCSFMITLLCLSSEQWCIRYIWSIILISREGIDRWNLANHLLQFFYYYGLLLNYDKLVLRVRNDGGYIEKEEKGWLEEGREYMLSVENPIDASLDIGKSSYNIKVRIGRYIYCRDLKHSVLMH